MRNNCILASSIVTLLATGCVVGTEGSSEPGNDDGSGDATDPPPDSAGSDSDGISTIDSIAYPLICSTTVDCGGGHQVDVFENDPCDYGRKFFFCPGNYPDLREYSNHLSFWENWNDRISGFNTRNVAVCVYQHINYQGDVRCFGNHEYPHLGGSLWNDQISSMRVFSL